MFQEYGMYTRTRFVGCKTRGYKVVIGYAFGIAYVHTRHKRAIGVRCKKNRGYKEAIGYLRSYMMVYELSY